MNILTDLKTLRFWRHCLLQTFACGGAISAIFQFLIMIFPKIADDVQGLAPLIIVGLISLSFGLFRAWPRPIEMEYSAPKTKIRIIKGNLLEQDSHLVVGVCNTFDTETPNIISRNSLLGQTIDKLYGGDYRRIDQLLLDVLKESEVIGQISKEGKTKLYPMGKVAIVKHDPRLIFFLAYCEMNNKNEAFSTIDNVWKSLFSLWEALSEKGNQEPVSIPVLGGGLARISNILPAQDSIRLIALSFMFASRKYKISNELRIVVQPQDYERLDRMEIQSFLSSLRPS